MNEYLIILRILLAVLAGKNLGEEFNKNTLNLTNINIGKIKDICYGLLRNYYNIREKLKTLATKNISNQEISIILLIAIYEIDHTKKPSFAVTNDLVQISYNLTKNKSLKNFVNAVIRNYLRNKSAIELQIQSKIEVKYNMPIWLINKLKSDYPEQYLTILNKLNLKPKIALRINPKKITIDKYQDILNKENIEFELIQKKIVLKNLVSINNIPQFSSGYVSIQDISAQQLIDFIEINDGFRILDACSAPGGKACQILENKLVDLTAIDIDQRRLLKVKDNIDRLGLTANLICADATNLKWWDFQLFDIIIADVPCSATGTIKRNPDIKLHRTISDIENFVNIQRKIVINLWNVLKPGGSLVYITCSIFKEENELNVNFLQQVLINAKIAKTINILPTEHQDGFFYCILEKRN